MSDKSPYSKTIFNIYKLNPESIKEIIDELLKDVKPNLFLNIKRRFNDSSENQHDEEKTDNCLLIYRKIQEEIKNKISKNEKPYKIEAINNKKFKLLIFKSSNRPQWEKIINEIIVKNSRDKNDLNISSKRTINIENTYVSYILLKQIENKIYIVTGGQGYHHIKQYIEKDYGLTLIPKLVNDDDPIVKRVMENNLTGNRIFIHRLNRNITPLNLENDLTSIYRELNLEIDRNLALKLGITFDESESENKKINLVSKDSISIKRLLSINELEIIIEKLSKLEEEPDKFPLNYFKRVKNTVKEEKFTEELIKLFKDSEDNPDSTMHIFSIVGNDFEEFYNNVEEYKIMDENEQKFLSLPEPIKIQDIYNQLENKGINLGITKAKTIIKKWKLQIIKEGVITLQVPLIKVLQGFLDHKSIDLDVSENIYLMNGLWYFLDEDFDKFLTKKFIDIFENKKNRIDQILNQFNDLKYATSGEDDYNIHFKDNEKIIMAHNATDVYTLIDNIEIADLIFEDDKTLYLMCNKTEFEALGVRDLMGQIETSSQFLLKKLSTNRDFVKKYYDKLSTFQEIDEDNFLKMFNKNICYIAGFIKNYKKDNVIRYGKYLIYDMDKKMQSMGYEFIPMSINFNE